MRLLRVACIGMLLLSSGCKVKNIILISDDSHDYGKVLVGSYSPTFRYAWRNNHTETGSVTLFVFNNAGGHFAKVGADLTGTTIAPRGRGIVGVEFAPQDKGKFAGTAFPVGVFVKRDGTQSQEGFRAETGHFQGEGVHQIVRYTIIDVPGNGAALDFGDVEVGATKVLPLTVTLAPPGAQGSPRYLFSTATTPSVEFDAPMFFSMPAAAAGAQATATIQISFTPPAPGEQLSAVVYEARIAMPNGLMSTATIGVTLKGKGVAPLPDEEQDH